MNRERWQKLKEIFHSALELEADERARFIEEVCADDEELKEEVESLLAHDEDGNDSIEEIALEIAARLVSDNAVDRDTGRIIGSYRVIGEISQGGMGTILLAARADDQFQKLVAIKLVKRGMDTDFIVSRFLSERQILAGFDHPNVARLFDGGATDDGLPYFVMEYIEGVAIDEYCDEQRLSITERLKLFLTVCSAVEYAHKKRVIHRDLKPTNILVTPEGVPKLLDFGIAKLLEPDYAEEAENRTKTAARFVTPSHASPEQLRGESVTVASDVYSLGVLFYELLTGHRPYELKSKTGEEIIRVVCEETPGNPSSVVTRTREAIRGDETITLTPEQVSFTRASSVEKLRRRLAGDLDMIALMALRKEPERRYQSVEEFSDDIRRHLERLPVRAQKDRLPYRGMKFIRRHSALVIAVALSALVIASVIVFSLLWVSSRINKAAPGKANSIAVLPFTVEGDEELGEEMADALSARLSRIGRIIVAPASAVTQYNRSDQGPAEAGRRLGVGMALSGRAELKDQWISVNLQLFGVSDGSLLWSERFEEDFSDRLAAENAIAERVAGAIALELTGEEKRLFVKRYTDNPEAYQLYMKGRFFWNKRTEEGINKSIEYFEKAIELDPQYALAYAGMAESYAITNLYSVNQIKDADPKAREAAVKALAIDDSLAEAHTALAYIKEQYDWDFAGAEREFKRALELNPNYATAHHWYSEYLAMMGRTEESIYHIRQAQRLDPTSLIINTQAGFPYICARRYDEAMREYQKALEMDPNFPTARIYLARCYEVKAMCEEAIAEYKKASGTGSLTLAKLGCAYAACGKKREAREVLNELMKLSKQRYISPYNIAVLHAALGEKDAAFASLAKAYEDRDAMLVTLKVDRSLDGLRSDPRFDDLLRRVGLVH